MGFFGEFAGALFGNLAGRGRGRGRGRGHGRSRVKGPGAGRHLGWKKGRRRGGLKRHNFAAKLARLEARPNCGWFCQLQKRRLAEKLAAMPAPEPAPAPPPTMSGYFGDWSYLK